MIKYIFVLLLGVCAFSFVEPQYAGVLDVQYAKSLAGSGMDIFKLADFELSAKFPIDPHHRLVYETHLASNNIEWARQFFFDIDPISIPGSFRLGRFNIPFGQEERRLADRHFIASRVIYDAYVSSDVRVIPVSETGIGYFHNTRPFSVDVFLVNANDSNKKTIGGDFRFLLKDSLDAGYSVLLADSVFIGGMDYHLPVNAFDFAFDLQIVSGMFSGASIAGTGVAWQALYALDKRVTFGTQFSSYSQNNLPSSSRFLLNGSLCLGYDMTLRLEFMSDHFQGSNDNVLQAQCQVTL
jgi:hypothetical protein